MKLLLFIAFMLTIGPLRRPILRRAGFTIPAIAGGVVGLVLGSALAAYVRLPPGMAGVVALLGAGAMAMYLGEAFKGWFDRVFGPRKDSHD